MFAVDAACALSEDAETEPTPTSPSREFPGSCSARPVSGLLYKVGA